MARKRAYRAITRIDPKALASFQAGIRKRYSDEQILEELRASAQRLGRSPTMREFAADPKTTVHPQTVIEHFRSWNAAKRAIRYGYHNVYWFPDGVEGWRATGQPTATVEPEATP